MHPTRRHLAAAAMTGVLAAVTIVGAGSAPEAQADFAPRPLSGYLRLSDAKGPIDDGATHPGGGKAIRVTGYDIEFTGGGACSPLKVTASLSMAWPRLAESAAERSLLTQAVLEVWKTLPTGQEQKVLVYEFPDAMLVNAHEIDATRDALVLDGFTAVKEKFIVHNPTMPTPPVQAVISCTR